MRDMTTFFYIASTNKSHKHQLFSIIYLTTHKCGNDFMINSTVLVLTSDGVTQAIVHCIVHLAIIFRLGDWSVEIFTDSRFDFSVMT